MLLRGDWIVPFQEMKKMLVISLITSLLEFTFLLLSTNCSLVIFIINKAITWLASPEIEVIVKSLRIQTGSWWDQLKWVAAQGKVLCGALCVTKMSLEIIAYFMTAFHNLGHPDICDNHIPSQQKGQDKGRQTGKYYNLKGVDVYWRALHHFKGLSRKGIFFYRQWKGRVNSDGVIWKLFHTSYLLYFPFSYSAPC